MKRYEIRKVVEAKNIKDAIKKDKESEVDYVAMVEEEFEEPVEEERVYGFRGK